MRRVLAKHYRPTHGSDGPPWLTFLGHAKDSLWSVDLFRCESLILKTHWVMVVMDQFTRRIIGFAVQAGAVDGPAICRMFNHAVAGAPTLPLHLSSDHDPLFEFHRWNANLRILDVTEVKTAAGCISCRSPPESEFATHREAYEITGPKSTDGSASAAACALRAPSLIG